MINVYKAIFLDMDGTLLNSQKEVSDKTIEILHRLAKKGIEIVLVSGRCNKSIKYIVKNRINKRYPIIRYIISTDGTLIKDIKENRIIYQNYLDANIVKELIKISQNLDAAFYVLTENNMYKDNRNLESQKELDDWYINGEFYNIKDNLTTIDFNKFDLNEKVNRILFFSKNSEELKKINDRVLSDGTIQTMYRKDHNNYQLLLVSKKYSKAIGVMQLCKYLNIPIEKTIAFGDSDNDIEMLNVVKKGIAMKNASKDLGVKEITLYTNNEDGVARYLEDII